MPSHSSERNSGRHPEAQTAQAPPTAPLKFYPLKTLKMTPLEPRDAPGMPVELIDILNSRRTSYFGLLEKVVGLIPSWYWKPRAFERWQDGRFYELLGIRIFKKYLPTSGDLVQRTVRTMLHSPKGIESKRGDDFIARQEMWTRMHESVHISFAIGMAASLACYSSGSNFGMILGGTANLLFNGYPIILQRYNRARIYNLMDKRLTLRAKRLGRF